MIVKEAQDWKDLQNKVHFILESIGLSVGKEVPVSTPRGSIEIDVFAIDPNSVDKIKYVIECKHWNTNIPQQVIHSFTTVMHETGANIGYIISKKGFQDGAVNYASNTNIRLFSFDQFQAHYFEIWYARYFAPHIHESAQFLLSYTEPINSRRFRAENEFSSDSKAKFALLLEQYSMFAFMLLIISNESDHVPNPFSEQKGRIMTIDEVKRTVRESLNHNLTASNYVDLLSELKVLIKEATEKFNEVFGKNIFSNSSD